MTSNMENIMKFKPNPDLKLMDQVGETLRYYHYVRSAEKPIANGFYAIFIFMIKIDILRI